MLGVSDDGLDGSVVGSWDFAPSPCQGLLCNVDKPRPHTFFCSVPKKDGVPLLGFFAIHPADERYQEKSSACVVLSSACVVLSSACVVLSSAGVVSGLRQVLPVCVLGV